MKKQIKKIINSKTLSVVLASAMIFLSIPTSIVGEDSIIGTLDSNDNAVLSNSNESFHEDESMRDEFSKHYVLESGERYAVVFPEAVHYEVDGEWNEIDNRLTYNAATGKYVSANPKFTAAFADNAASSELVSISDGEYTVSWSLSFAKIVGGELMQVTADNSAASVTNGADTDVKLAEAKTAQASLARTSAETNQVFDKEAAEKSYKDAVTNIGKASSGVSYANVMDGAVSLRYSVLHKKVEEDIILRSKSDFTSYTMTVNTDGLLVTAETDGTVKFKTSGGDTMFIIDSPWMKDSAYGFSKDIDVTVTQNGNTATLTYTPSAEWLNSPDRVYPVLIDPTVTTGDYTNCFEDTHVLSGDTDFTYYSDSTLLSVGMSPVGEWLTYIKITYFPSFNNQNVTVTDGSLVVCTSYTPNYPLNLYETTSSWCGETYAPTPTVEPISGENSSAYNSTYGKYSYNLNLWIFIDKINTDYNGDYNSYFGEIYDGFMINSFSTTTDEVTMLDSTEAGTATPMLTLAYTVDEEVEPDVGHDCFTENAVYNIKQPSTSKYMTVHDGLSATGTNVYQETENGSTSQAFKFIYCGEGKYKIQPLCCPESKVIGADMEYIYDTEEPANVQLYDNTESNSENIEWNLEFIEQDKFKIALASYPDWVLTIAYSASQSGSAEGIYANSPGNIIVDYDLNTLVQRWSILSGGQTIENASDISKCTETTLAQGTSMKLNCSVEKIGATVTLSSSDISIARVDGHVITGIAMGETTIIARETNLDGSIEEKTLNLNVIPPNTIKHYIKNASNGSSLEIDSSMGTNLILTEDDNDDNLEWLLIYSNGYYIIENEISGGYLTAPETFLDCSNVVCNSPGLYVQDTQLWKITRLDNGNYKIQSKYHENSNLVLAKSEDDLGNVVLSQFGSGDIEGIDEWEMAALYDSSFIAIPDPSHGDNHAVSFPSVLSSISNIGYNTNRTVEYIDVSSCIDYIKTSMIFYTRCHGSKISIQLANNEPMTIYHLDTLPSDAFDRCKLVLYGSCRTAEGGEQGNNLVAKTHAKGAKSVVGFPTEVLCSELSKWSEIFFRELGEGKSVEQACVVAGEEIYFHFPNGDIKTNLYVIAGMKDQTLD